MLTYDKCRCCGNEDLKTWLSMPHSPVANALFSEPNHNRYPLDLNYCSECGHLQLAGAPDPDGVFETYKYKSGVSKSFRNHFKKYAFDVTNLVGYGKNSKLLEIGSNDGFLLEEFKNMHFEVMGVEPYEFLREEHNKRGVPVVTDFFGVNLVKKYAWENMYDVVCANNVLAHIPDTLDVVNGIALALRPGGALVVECGDQSGIVSGEYLDNVYHEHIDYYTPYSFSKLLERAGLVVDEVLSVPTHGISFRIVARKRFDTNGLKFNPLDMTEKLETVIDHIAKRETRIKSMLDGRSFIAYGAAAKAVTSLYTLNLVDEKLVSVVDDNELKQGYYFPGTDILIGSPDSMDKDALVLITAWNVFDDIKKKLVDRGHRGEILCIQ